MRVILALSCLLLFSQTAHAIVIVGSRGGAKSQWSQQICKKNGYDQDRNQLWTCRSNKKGGGEKPIMRCHYVERSNLKMVYCSDGSKIRVP